MHRKKIGSAPRNVSKTPMELLTRKIQWRGKDIRKIVPYNKPELRKVVLSKLGTDKALLNNLQGWDG